MQADRQPGRQHQSSPAYLLSSHTCSEHLLFHLEIHPILTAGPRPIDRRAALNTLWHTSTVYVEINQFNTGAQVLYVCRRAALKDVGAYFFVTLYVCRATLVKFRLGKGLTNALFAEFSFR
jgi:hypothetical protein